MSTGDSHKTYVQIPLSSWERAVYSHGGGGDVEEDEEEEEECIPDTHTEE